MFIVKPSMKLEAQHTIFYVQTNYEMIQLLPKDISKIDFLKNYLLDFFGMDHATSYIVGSVSAFEGYMRDCYEYFMYREYYLRCRDRDRDWDAVHALGNALQLHDSTLKLVDMQEASKCTRTFPLKILSKEEFIKDFSNVYGSENGALKRLLYHTVTLDVPNELYYQILEIQAEGMRYYPLFSALSVEESNDNNKRITITINNLQWESLKPILPKEYRKMFPKELTEI